MLIIYKVKGKISDLEFIFKYDLNGFLIEFKKNQPLTEEQRLWLYSDSFPENEELMQNWISVFKRKFEIIKVPADLSFENLWSIYDYKLAKADEIKAFAKLKDESDIIKCFLGVKQYEDHLAKTKTAKAHLSRYINGRYFDNEY